MVCGASGHGVFRDVAGCLLAWMHLRSQQFIIDAVGATTP
jgi:hypothetical protein